MAYTAAVITISDKGSRGERIDTSGPAICSMLQDAGYEVVHTVVIPDEKELIEKELIACCDERKVNLVLTTGGTGFAPRDVTPEATMAVAERSVPGIPELMRAESCKITSHGSLSRGMAGIRGRTLMINLPGSEKAVRENLAAVLKPIGHGLKMLLSEGSADCAAPAVPSKKMPPSIDTWLKEAKAAPDADKVGMYLTHNGVVRATAKSLVREGDMDAKPVSSMYFACDNEKAEAAISKARAMEGVYYVRVWLNEGELQVGDDIMFVLIGGDTRPHVVEAFQTLVSTLKNECVTEKERYH